MPKHTVKLEANGLTFTAYSNYSQADLAKKKPEKILLLLHGFPDDNGSWDEAWPLVEPRLGSKWLILAPRLRGYEPSSVASDDYSYGMANLADDVAVWIETYRPSASTPVHLVGHDWGALVAFKTASLRPDLLTSISTLAIPYLANMRPLDWLRVPIQLWYSSYMLTMQSAYFYASRFNVATPTIPYLNSLWQFWSPSWKFSNESLEAVSTTLKQPGVIDAATSYYRCMFRDNRRKRLDWKVDFSKVPTLLIGGIEDGCMHHKLYDIQEEKLKDVPTVKVVQVPGVGHFMHREDPEKITTIFLDWIEAHGGL